MALLRPRLDHIPGVTGLLQPLINLVTFGFQGYSLPNLVMFMLRKLTGRSENTAHRSALELTKG